MDGMLFFKWFTKTWLVSPLVIWDSFDWSNTVLQTYSMSYVQKLVANTESMDLDLARPIFLLERKFIFSNFDPSFWSHGSSSHAVSQVRDCGQIADCSMWKVVSQLLLPGFDIISGWEARPFGAKQANSTCFRGATMDSHLRFLQVVVAVYSCAIHCHCHMQAL